jgi:hypothetical protein
LQQLCPCEENQEVIQESDHRNVTRDQLNGTKHVASATSRDYFCVPRSAGMLEHKIINLSLPLQSLHLICAALPKRGLATDDICAIPAK